MAIIFNGTGCHIPAKKVNNQSFADHHFLDEKGKKIPNSNEVIIKKFRDITGIEERRYANDDQQTSDLAFLAAKEAIANSNINPETIDGIIVAHNFGNTAFDSAQSDMVPSLATRIKHSLAIKNPSCIAFDVLFGCPGWLQGVIIAEQFLRAGSAKRFLVVGSETLSRVTDPYDRDSMIYSDGAGATIIERIDNNSDRGILASISQTHSHTEAYYLYNGESYKEGYTPGRHYLKMAGRKIYEFALNNVPIAMKTCMDNAGLDIKDLKKVFIHQANEKMDEAILERFYQLYGINEVPEYIMPMSIHMLGNSSVATVPTLFDMVLRGQLENHNVAEGDLVLFASVGAGMNISAIAYRM